MWKDIPRSSHDLELLMEQTILLGRMAKDCSSSPMENIPFLNLSEADGKTIFFESKQQSNKRTVLVSRKVKPLRVKQKKKITLLPPVTFYQHGKYCSGINICLEEAICSKYHQGLGIPITLFLFARRLNVSDRLQQVYCSTLISLIALSYRFAFRGHAGICVRV
ncbi:hypothetical protein CEXT_336511 [Caerostris extrusa]|uniref:Uncharacterized protein n=1 Tax=Caerostris extrusa TaxID=172846 RepID=A0AAV4XEQ7_CAEEX|nr:hypothetical protein CEXT_336511 [Caerostris extrusa]